MLQLLRAINQLTYDINRLAATNR